MQQPDKRTSLPFFLVQLTSSFFSCDMLSPNKDSVGKPVRFSSEKGNGCCAGQKQGRFFFSSYEHKIKYLCRTNNGRNTEEMAHQIVSPKKTSKCYISILPQKKFLRAISFSQNDVKSFVFSSMFTCSANCFRCLGLGGSHWRYGGLLFKC